LSQAIVEAGHFSGEESLSAVDYNDDKSDILVRGFIARPLHFRGDRKGILAIVNNRPVRCPLTYKALEYAYSDLIPRGKHPLAVVSVNLGANQVDVNVHPTKKEIKYSSGNDVYVTIQRALIESLRNAAWKDNARVSESSEEQIDFAPEPRVASITYVESDFANDAAGAQAPESGFDRTQKQLGFRNRLYYRPAITESSQSYPDSFINENRPVQPTLPASWRLLGYLLHTYILVETPDGLEVIEQHIAHERTLYERFLEMQKTKGRTADGAQRLLISASLKLTSEQKALVKQNLELLQSFGFDFEFSSDSKDDVICTQVPLELAHKNYSVAVQEIIEQLSVTDNANMSLEATKSLACQAAIKNGMPLSEDDILRLISDWYTTPRNDTCPHGRPVRLRFSMEKLFQLFHPA
jgi:DNA mismatch repair protein MutL